MASGLVRARALLAKRLTRRGLAVSGGTLAATLSHSAASADVPASVVTSTTNVATLLAAGKAAGEISGPVATLTQEVLKTMFLKKILTKSMAVLALGVAVLTCGSLAVGQTEEKPAVGKDVKAPVAEIPMKPAASPEKEPFTAWGKEVGGMQAGLGFKAGEKRAYHHDEGVTLVLRVRNVGKEEVKFSYYHDEFLGSPPTVTDDGGKHVPLEGVHGLGIPVRIDVTLSPGKTVDLSEANLALRPVGDKGQKMPAWTLFGTGNYQLQCDQAGGSIRDQSGPDPILSKLATGKLELEVKEPEKGPQDKKEAFTAWGQESGGLQAGLGLLPGAKRVCRHGETVTLVVRVRNVGKEAVKFEYVRQFLDENPPAVTTADGKAVPQSRTRMEGFHGPTLVTLEPGKEIVLETRMHGAGGSPFALLPEDGGLSATKTSPLFVGTGKVSLHYDAVFGNSSSGTIKLDPAL